MAPARVGDLAERRVLFGSVARPDTKLGGAGALSG